MNAPHEPLSRMLTAHPWHGIAPGDPENCVTVYVEIVPTDDPVDPRFLVACALLAVLADARREA